MFDRVPLPYSHGWLGSLSPPNRERTFETYDFDRGKARLYAALLIWDTEPPIRRLHGSLACQHLKEQSAREPLRALFVCAWKCTHMYSICVAVVVFWCFSISQPILFYSITSLRAAKAEQEVAAGTHLRAVLHEEHQGLSAVFLGNCGISPWTNSWCVCRLMCKFIVVKFGGVGASGGQMVRHEVVVVEYPEYLLQEITGRLQYEQQTLLWAQDMRAGTLEEL